MGFALVVSDGNFEQQCRTDVRVPKCALDRFSLTDHCGENMASVRKVVGSAKAPGAEFRLISVE